ncbi:hypothetical protein CQW23_17426 [Capsicum baccatum]|uniref:Uncharacterized protein n=1 Tax=Capsicum baccatum TaxID=33114 RepID=A0A2G2WDT7_CAPBA|nr:hypothetical protein CQW23_17426 [Capsicum baccatum]
MTIPIPFHRNSSYDEFITSIMQNRDLDCTLSDVVISYVMHLREKVNSTIINSDAHVLTYIMDVDTDGFRLIWRINVVERSFEGPLNSSAPSPQRPAVDDDLINNDLNDYEKDVDDTINMEDYSMHMKDFSSDSQDAEKDREMESQAGHSFTDETNFYYGQTFADKKEQKIELDAAVARQFFNYYMEKICRKLMKVQCLSRGCGGYCGQKTMTPWIDFAYTTFGACIQGYAHMRKVIAINGTHLYGKYDVMTTNIAESLNSILMDEQEYPVSYIFNSIAKNFDEKFRKMHAFVGGKENIFMPSAERILRDNKSASDSLYMGNSNGILDEYMVFGNSVTAKVSLLERSYSC